MKYSESTIRIKPIKFLLLLFISYLILSQGNLFMNSVLNVGGRYYNEFLYQNLNYIQWLRKALIVPSQWILEIFGYKSIANNQEIQVIGGIKLNVNYSCLGLGVMSFIVAYVLAFPSRIQSKWKVVIFTCFLVYLLNIVRISVLGILFTKYIDQRKSLAYHHEFFNILIYIVVLTILYLWMKRQLKISSPN